jgi:hypothetical protein
MLQCHIPIQCDSIFCNVMYRDMQNEWESFRRSSSSKLVLISRWEPLKIPIYFAKINGSQYHLHATYIFSICVRDLRCLHLCWNMSTVCKRSCIVCCIYTSNACVRANYVTHMCAVFRQFLCISHNVHVHTHLILDQHRYLPARAKTEILGNLSACICMFMSQAWDGAPYKVCRLTYMHDIHSVVKFLQQCWCDCANTCISRQCL